jgi:hypothetical protein
MKKANSRNLILFTLCMIILNSCTGTAAPTAPLFVIAGLPDKSETTDTNEAGIIVLQDRVLEPNAPTPRFVRFTDKPIPLAATPRAFDIVGEASTRDELVVLSRSQAEDTARTVSAYLDFFNTRGLEVADSNTFRTSRPRVDLRTLTYPAPLTVDTLCPIDMEVTSTGLYAVIFSSPSVCFPGSGTADDAIIVITLPSRPSGTTPASVASAIRSFNEPAKPLVRTSVFSNGVSRAGMFLDQSGDTLYYLRQEGVNSLDLRSLASFAYTQSNPETPTNTAQTISSAISIGSEEFRDISKVSGTNPLAILGVSSYVLAPTSRTDNAEPQLKEVKTLTVRSQDNRTFLSDATATRLFILDDNDKLVYHPDPTLETNSQAQITTGVVSTINTTSNFLYIAATRRLNVFDTQPLFNENSTNLDASFIEENCDTNQATDGLCALDNPTALTWIEGILPPSNQ